MKGRRQRQRGTACFFRQSLCFLSPCCHPCPSGSRSPEGRGKSHLLQAEADEAATKAEDAREGARAASLNAGPPQMLPAWTAAGSPGSRLQAQTQRGGCPGGFSLNAGPFADAPSADHSRAAPERWVSRGLPPGAPRRAGTGRGSRGSLRRRLRHAPPAPGPGAGAGGGGGRENLPSLKTGFFH